MKRFFGSIFHPTTSKPTSAPTWLTQQELAPVDTSTPPRWLDLRNGTTPNGFHFKMTLEEYKRIMRGSGPSEGGRIYIINSYYRLINYLNQLDYGKPAQVENFLEWKKWWGKSLDLVIPKSELVDEHKKAFYESYDPRHQTFKDFMKLNSLEYQVFPKPVLDPTPPMFDLARHSRFPEFKFIPYEWDENIEGDYAKYTRINRAGNKYKRTKRHKKFKKHTKKHTKKYTKKYNKKYTKKYTKKYNKKYNKNT